MTDALTVSAQEQGRVRVFALDLPPEQIRFQQEPGAVEALLQTHPLDPAFFELFDVADLDDIGLTGYLIDGCGVPEAQIAPKRQLLDAVTGSVLVVLSRAFGEAPATLSPVDGVRLIAAFSTEPVDWTATPITSESALPYSAVRPSPRAARSQARRIGGALFTVMMIVIVLVLFLAVT